MQSTYCHDIFAPSRNKIVIPQAIRAPCLTPEDPPRTSLAPVSAEPDWKVQQRQSLGELESMFLKTYAQAQQFLCQATSDTQAEKVVERFISQVVQYFGKVQESIEGVKSCQTERSTELKESRDQSSSLSVRQDCIESDCERLRPREAKAEAKQCQREIRRRVRWTFFE